MDTASLDSDAGTDRIDALVVALDCYFGTFAWFAGHILDGDEAVVYLGNLQLEKPAQEARVGAGDDYLGVVVGVVDTFHDGAYHVALVEEVTGNLLLFRQDQLVLVLVNEKHLALPYLMDFGSDDFSFYLFEFGIDSIFLEVEDLRLQGLTEIKDGAASEFLEKYLFGHFLSYLAFRVDLACLRKTDLHVFVLDFSVGNHLEVLVDLAVSLVGVHDDVEVLVRAELLCKHVAE